MSGAEIASVLLDLPGYVDNFVKACRAIKEYKELDSAYNDLMQRAILNSKRFKHLSTFILDPTSYSEATREYVLQLVRQSRLSMERTLRIVNDWKERLGIKENVTELRTKRLIPSVFYCFGKNSTETKEENTSYIQERLAEAEYMIIGKLEIASAMESLEHYLNILNLAILTSDRLSITPEEAQDTPDIIKFVAHARRRVESNAAINLIDDSVLMSLSDIDSEMPTGIYRVDSGPFSGCIVDPRDVWHYAGGSMNIAWDETRNIARLFAEDEADSDLRLSSSVGILPSCGYSELDTHLHAIVFRLPPGISAPRTLRSLLVEGAVQHSLDDRVDFAIRLAMSVLVVHSLGLVHKSIRPDSIIVTENSFGNVGELYPYKLGTPYLLAFDSSRSTRGPTTKHPLAGPEGFLWQTVYRHPRHFPDRQYKYEMRDDIYSLGICLFEVALWKSLFRWNQAANSFEENRSVLDLSNSRCKTEAEALGKPNTTNLMWLRRYLLMEAAKQMIPPILGVLFKDVVVACLTFGEPSNISRSKAFASRFEVKSNLSPADQSLYFVRDVLSKLQSIKLS